ERRHGKKTLQAIDVDRDGNFEQLVQQNLGERDDIASNNVEVLGAHEPNEVKQALDCMVDHALEADFGHNHADRPRGVVIHYSDGFRLRLGHDEPIDAEPLEAREQCTTVRSGPRRYPEMQRHFQ
ncbi:hypothetical protein F444_09335, partial [Phytophthora nicotianae P1976]